MRHRMIVLVLAAALVALPAFPAAAWAHVPVLEPYAHSDAAPQGRVTYPGATPLEGPTSSLVVYGYLAVDERFDAYRFTVPRTVTTTVGVLVPVRSGTADFRPVLSVLIGGRVLGEVSEQVAARPSFYEPFSFQYLYSSGEQRFTFEPGQDYVLLVEKGRGTATFGPYVIAFSGPEEFDPGDILRSLVVVPRIWLGLYGQNPLNPWPLVGLVVLVIAIGLVVSVLRERRRRASLARRTVRRL